jgi:methylated-DNA-[protein]-cysteine S-methyltransferase
MPDPAPDPLTTALAGLAVDAPPHLLDRVAVRWARVPAPAPLGEVAVAFTDRGVCYLRTTGPDFAASFHRRFARPLLPADRAPDGVADALHGGDPGAVRLDLTGLRPFQADVLTAARAIAPGEIRPYAWIARRIGRPRAVRAVGTALGTNPVPLLIPCHRVTRSDGGIGEYVFGAAAKAALLHAEGAPIGGTP